MIENNSYSIQIESKQTVLGQLANMGYRPARAMQLLLAGKFSKTIELCKEYLTNYPKQISVRLIYAKALYNTGQVESASEQFYLVLSQDPNNCVALKILGDIKFAEGDEIGAMSNYSRVLRLDPCTSGLRSMLPEMNMQRRQTIKLVHGREGNTSDRSQPLLSVPFYTETLGDLYYSQGHNRLAVEVFKKLIQEGDNPRLLHKLSEAEAATQEKER